MTQTVKTSGLIMLFFAAGTIVSMGCNQADTSSGESSDTNVSAKAAVDKPTETGCCGMCAAEKNTSEKNAPQKANACCGKCEAEAAAIPVKKTEAGCPGECDACAKGDSANCKCDPATGEKLSVGKLGASTDHVNTMPQDRDIFHFLLQNHDKITRTVTEIENGVQTVTESTDSAIASKIQEHVASMHKRIEDGRPLRMWDELYREIFKHADKIEMDVKKTNNGVAVTETSEDPYVVKLIQSHAKVVTGFTKKGFEEAHLNHEPPTK